MTMVFESVRTAGIAQLSYLVGDDGSQTAAVIDPRPEVEIYIELSRKHGVTITHIFETHIHADFMSGAREGQICSGLRRRSQVCRRKNSKRQSSKGSRNSLTPGKCLPLAGATSLVRLISATGRSCRSGRAICSPTKSPFCSWWKMRRSLTGFCGTSPTWG